MKILHLGQQTKNVQRAHENGEAENEVPDLELGRTPSTIAYIITPTAMISP